MNKATNGVLAGLVVVLLAVAAGCGGGGSDADASSTGSTTGTTTTSTTTSTTDASTISGSDTSSTTGSSSEATAAANAFLATLSTSQQSSALLAWNLSSARHWSNLPAQLASRYGIAWGSLSTDQKVAARTLISTALGATGNTMHLGWQMADNYLNSIGGGSSYGEGPYYISILGTPSDSSFWMLQLTGHHLTFNVSFNGSYKSGTPAFIGIEPKAAFTYNGTSYDPMSAQREAVASLGAALTAYTGAKLSGTYSDLLFGANSGSYDGACPRAYASVTEHGALYTTLSAAHQVLVQNAIKAYVNSQNSSIASDMLAAYLDETALAATYVAYAGTGTVAANGNYFRIEGPRVWIEFSVQRGVIIANDIHFHTVWRDKLADYGGACV